MAFRQVPERQRSPMSPQEFGNRLQASFDVTKSTPENTRHWQWIDYLSADESLSPDVRKKIRAQARYECVQNGSYGVGMSRTLVTDTIGTGPRVSVSQFQQTINQLIEREFMHWADAIGLAEKLQTMRMAKLVDGESVAKFSTNTGVEHPVMLDLMLVECDQLTTTSYDSPTVDYVDGIHLQNGYPVAYDILRQHPGSGYGWGNITEEYDTYPREQIIHLFRCDRPGQHRGVSEYAAALPLFAFLRRYTLATVAAAETAASVSQVIQTDAPMPEDYEDDSWNVSTFDKWMDAIPIDRNSATVLPNQWELKQFAAEHPTTTHEQFKRSLVSEIGRCINMPANIATLDSGQSNYSSARFDHLGYERTIQNEQSYFNRNVMDRVFSEWLVEAALTGVLPTRASNSVLQYNSQFGSRGLSNNIQHAWHWDGLRDADATNAAQAQRMRLQNGSTQREREYAEQGLDIEIEDAKAAVGLGIDVPTYRKWLSAAIFTNGNLLSLDPDEEETKEEPSTEESKDESKEQVAESED